MKLQIFNKAGLPAKHPQKYTKVFQGSFFSKIVKYIEIILDPSQFSLSGVPRFNK